jgi:hypothetical protein
MGGPEPFRSDMGVYLGRGDVHMSQHDLNRPKVRPAIQEVGGKGMAKGMRMDFVFQPRHPSVFFYDFPKTLPGEPVPETVQKQYPNGSFRHESGADFIHVSPQQIKGRSADRDNPLFASFAACREVTDLPIDASHGKVRYLRDA